MQKHQYELVVIGISAGLLMGARSQMDLGTLMRWTFFPNSSHVLDSEIPDLYLRPEDK